MTVQPRPTPAERATDEIEVEVDEPLTTAVDTIEEWITPRQSWEVQFREGTEFDRPNNVEVRLLFAAGEQTSTLAFRLDQLDAATDTDSELILRFEEHDGIGTNHIGAKRIADAGERFDRGLRHRIELCRRIADKQAGLPSGRKVEDLAGRGRDIGIHLLHGSEDLVSRESEDRDHAGLLSQAVDQRLELAAQRRRRLLLAEAGNARLERLLEIGP
jgi:hypothetical protein